MADIKVKPNEDQEQDFKPFEVAIKDINWKMRCELNDMMLKENSNGAVPNFTWWGNVVLKYTELKELELNKYSTDEIIGIANTIFEIANKKK